MIRANQEIGSEQDQPAESRGSRLSRKRRGASVLGTAAAVGAAIALTISPQETENSVGQPADPPIEYDSGDGVTYFGDGELNPKYAGDGAPAPTLGGTEIPADMPAPEGSVTYSGDGEPNPAFNQDD